MATITTLEKAPVIDTATGEPLGVYGATTHDVVSSDPAIASIAWLDWRPWVIGQTVGTVTVTATRLSDGAIATLEVTVDAGPFEIDLGTAEPK